MKEKVKDGLFCGIAVISMPFYEVYMGVSHGEACVQQRIGTLGDLPFSYELT